METLILFADTPLPGSKARLARDRGEEAALRLAAAFLLDAAGLCHAWRDERVGVDQNRRLVVYAAPDAQDAMMVDVAFRAHARLEPQTGDSPVSRLKNAFEAEFARGARAVCAISGNSPTLPVHLLDLAFRALLWERVTLGPTFDGGIWLVGAQRPAPAAIFDEMAWSTKGVLARMLGRLRSLSVEPHLLPFWYDLDDAADLERLVWHARALRARTPGALAETWHALQNVGLVAAETPVDVNVAKVDAG